MFLRALTGLLIGLLLGTVVGGTGFFIHDLVFPTPLFDGGYPSLQGLIRWNTFLGFIICGLPGSVVGALTAGFNFDKYYSAVVGAVFGLLLVITGNLHSLLNGENIIFEPRQTGWTPLYGQSLFVQLMLIIGLAVLGCIISAILKRRVLTPTVLR